MLVCVHLFCAAVCYHDCVLVSKTQMNHNTFMFRLQLPRGTVLFVPVGKHVYLKALVQGQRPGAPDTILSRTNCCSTNTDNTTTIDGKSFKKYLSVCVEWWL